MRLTSIASAVVTAAMVTTVSVAVATDSHTTTTSPTCESTGHGLFNPCARLDPTQVQDRRHEHDGMAPCIAEDGSTPGQAFPCWWDASTRGNGEGYSFQLDGPA